MTTLTVGDIRKAIEGLPDDMPVSTGNDCISPVAMFVCDYEEWDHPTEKKPPDTLIIDAD